MEIKRKVFITIFLLILVIGFFYFFTDWFSKTTGYSINEDEVDKLVGCLTMKNVSLYGFKDCKSCEKQKEFFGKSIKSIGYIECPDSRCQGIVSFPVWKINNVFYYGIKDFDELINIDSPPKAEKLEDLLK